MRLIGTLPHENQARRLGAYLKRVGLESSFEVQFDAQTGQMSYQLWVHDEDQMQKAKEILARFEKDPNHAEFDTPLLEQIQQQEEIIEEEEAAPAPMPLVEKANTYFTHGLLILCTLVFLINGLERLLLQKEDPTQQSLLWTPIEMQLFYDVPTPILEIAQIIQKHQIPADQPITEWSSQVKTEIETAAKAPFWHGFYEWMMLKIQTGNPAPAEGPLFSLIRQGEIWRLFSPAVLHQDPLHILFNMIWLWMLGKPIERRLGLFRYVLLTLICALFSNTAQYLMSGPFFLGYSGVILGLAGFIWVREKLAPWEGYPVSKPTLLFLFFFVGAICALQIGSFFIQLFSSSDFSPNIANTAHLTGLFVGMGLGRFPFFAQRVQ